MHIKFRPFLLIANIYNDEELAKEKVYDAINNGQGLNKLKQMIEYQGGDSNVIEHYELLPHAEEEIDLEYLGEDIVYIHDIDALKIGEAAMLLGAGRLTKEDQIDYAVGVSVEKKIGDKLSHGDVIAKIYTNGKNTQDAMNKIFEAFSVSEEAVTSHNIILDVIRGK